MTTTRDRYHDLRRQRSDLKMEGKVFEQIPIQIEVVQLASELGLPHEKATAWNTLASLYYQTQQYELAEEAAIKSIDNYDPEKAHAEEHLATYKFLLARILVAQKSFAEAVEFGEKALLHFSVLHNPPTEFLRLIVAEVEKMRCYNDQQRIDVS